MFELLIAAKAFRAGLLFGIFTKPRPRIEPPEHIYLIATPHRKGNHE